MMLEVFPMLMYTISLALYETMVVAVHNHYPDIELVSPVYFCDGRTYNEYTVEKTDVGTVMSIGFRLGLLDELPNGILMCEVQRKGNTKSDHQPNTDTTSTVSDKTSKMM
jgi:hypothetical protein